MPGPGLPAALCPVRVSSRLPHRTGRGADQSLCSLQVLILRIRSAAVRGTLRFLESLRRGPACTQKSPRARRSSQDSVLINSEQPHEVVTILKVHSASEGTEAQRALPALASLCGWGESGTVHWPPWAGSSPSARGLQVQASFRS